MIGKETLPTRHNAAPGEGGVMGKRISVTYQGPLDMELDKKIKLALEGIGAEWTGQGTDLTTNVRDISFDLKAK